ncbi:MAG: DNA polymerase III subunit gamma/tau [Candidatus Limivicinus sp.]|jgi:DNA polymerase-3 subunit gamma/tau
MYQALYRKWRPQTFDEVVGQEHITETLKNQVRSGRLSHAYIFIGTRGTGKTTCARILAKAVNCEHPVDGNPCGKCAACRGIADGSVLDVVELDAASNNGVDNVRALRDEAVFSPAAVKKRVYIIDEVHMLSTSAFNALLKILEEPPKHLMFILATTELQKVPATILSRCQRHSFRRIDSEKLADYLKYIAEKESFNLTADAAMLIARMAEGGVRDALSLLDQCSAYENIDTEAVYSAIGLAGNRRIAQMLDYILAHDADSALTEFSGMWMDGKDPSTFVKELSGLLRDTLIMHVASKKGGSLVSGGYEPEVLKKFSKRLSTEELIAAMETLQRCMDSLRDAKNPRTAVELCLISLCDNIAGESLNALRARVSRLEKCIAEGGVQPAAPAEIKAEEKHHEQPSPEAPAPEMPEIEITEPPEDDVPPFDIDDIPPEKPVLVPPDDYIPEHRAPSVNKPERAAEAAPEPEKARQTGQKEITTEQEAAPRAEKTGSSTADDQLWKEICDAAADGLPMDVKFLMGDRTKVTAALEGDTLRIRAVAGFTYGRLNRQEVLHEFSLAASKITGRELRAVLSETEAQSGKHRSLDELEKFKEVQIL